MSIVFLQFLNAKVIFFIYEIYTIALTPYWPCSILYLICVNAYQVYRIYG